jgi:GNAT superfamily N-acetyltransferase
LASSRAPAWPEAKSPSAAPPAAAVAFRFDRAARSAQLAGIGVRFELRGRGLGRRLLAGALTWLRADGFEQVHADAGRDGAAASLLASRAQAAAKSPPSRRDDPGRVNTNRAGDPGAPPLLVRQAVLAGEQGVAALLCDVPVDPRQVADLIRHHGVFVLSDLTLPPAAPPLAVAAFRLHRRAGTAQLAGIAVRLHLRRRGLGHRLLTGALTWLRADGFEQVDAVATRGGAAAALLASAGFTAATGQDADRADGRSRRLVLLL